MDHPYSALPERAFWKSAVADRSALELRDLYAPRFEITPQTRIAAAGSCFAQHLGRQFKARGYRFLDLEPGPDFASKGLLHRFGFDLYSLRHGNIYTARQLVQLFDRAGGRFTPEVTLWEEAGRAFDPFRPAIEPDGFASAEEGRADIAWHLARAAELLRQTDLFVFTFGLTEGWIDARDGAALPTCPGTVAGTFDADRHEFRNWRFSEVLEDTCRFVDMALAENPAMKFLFTVSPVPLTATASGGHVLPATVYSKSVLRAVCGEMCALYPQVAYFPSYELVAGHPMRGMFFQPNLRGVSEAGVAHVMEHFFAAHPPPDSAPAATPEPDEEELICEEAILEASAP